MNFTNNDQTGNKYENKLCKDVENCDEQAYCNKNEDNKCVFNIIGNNEEGLRADYVDRFAKELTYNQY